MVGIRHNFCSIDDINLLYISESVLDNLLVILLLLHYLFKLMYY